MRSDAMLGGDIIDYSFKTFLSWKDRLEREFTKIRVSLTQHEEGGDIRNTVVFSIQITDAPNDQPDLLEMVLEVLAHEGSYVFNIDLVWGDGDGQVEMMFNHAPVQADDYSIGFFKDNLPQFYDALFISLKSGKPSRESPIVLWK